MKKGKLSILFVMVILTNFALVSCSGAKKTGCPGAITYKVVNKNPA